MGCLNAAHDDRFDARKVAKAEVPCFFLHSLNRIPAVWLQAWNRAANWHRTSDPAGAEVCSLDVCEAAGGRGGRPGSAFPRIPTLSPNTFSVLGERARVRGPEGAALRNRRFVPIHMNRTRKRLIRDGARNAPLSQPLPPNRPTVGASGGEEMKWVETLTQGGARHSCALLALGYNSVALYRAPRGSRSIVPLHFSRKVQSPVTIAHGGCW
jgi:hypothetical protein